MAFAFSVLSYSSATSSTKQHPLVGNWIKVNTKYLDGAALEEQHPMKYSFLKYSFKPGGKAAIVTDFLSEGSFHPYDLKNSTLEISTTYGAKVKLKIAYLTKDSLLVIQEGPLGRNDPGSLSITFVRNDHLQKISEWGATDYISTKSKDTIYKASHKIYPVFSNPDGFKNSLQKNMKSFEKYMLSSAKDKGLFFATFVVTKSGAIENIKIIQGMDEQFNKEFIAACKKTEKKWTPAYYNNKPVDSQVTLEINFDFLTQFLSDQSYIYYAMRQLEKGNFENAITYFDKMLSLNPKNEKALIFRGECYLKLNDPQTACEDFRILKNLGFDSGEALLQKYCK
ncbi:energy transducer TonB [Sphingobacterium olei]|nr:energy transducer TonB [Sphingobacterium olei]